MRNRQCLHADHARLFIFGDGSSRFAMLIDLRESKPRPSCRRPSGRRRCGTAAAPGASRRRCRRRVAECRYRVAYLAKRIGANDGETNAHGNFFIRL